MFYIVKKLLHFLLRRKKKVKINCQKFIKNEKKKKKKKFLNRYHYVVSLLT